MGFTIGHFIFAFCIMVAVNSNLAVRISEYDLFVLSRRTNHTNAVELCLKHDMNLIRIEDKYTNKMVYNFASQLHVGQYWIDGKRGSDGKRWFYDDDSKLTYSKWQPGEPNNFGGNENCINGAYYKRAYWNDIRCDIEISAICQAEKSNEDIVTINENQLVALETKADYKTAVNLCHQQGMDLIKIQNKETNEIVYDFAVEKGLGQYWIDANDIATEGLWVSSDENRIVYSKWQPGEPNNYIAQENCAHGSFYKNGYWNDYFCDRLNSVICYKTK